MADRTTQGSLDQDRRVAVQLLLGVVGLIAFCVYSRSWQDLPHLIYDIPAALAVYSFVAQVVVEWVARGMNVRVAARLALIAAMTVVCVGRDFLHWPISGHLSCVLAVALVQAADDRLSRLERLLYWIPLPIVLVIRWTLFDRGEHWQTYNAVLFAVAAAAPVALVMRRQLTAPSRTQAQSRRRPRRAQTRGVRPSWGAPAAPPSPTLRPTPSTETPPEPSEPAPPAISDRVNFSVFAPSVVRPGSQFLLSLWAWLEQQREQMLERAARGGERVEAGHKGPVKIRRGSEIIACLDLPGFEIEEMTESLWWEGEVGHTDFAVTAPSDLKPRTYLGKLTLLCAGLQVARLRFEITVGAVEAQRDRLPVTEARVRSAFASYASPDRLEVLKWQWAARSVGCEVFVDVVSLRAGDRWEEELDVVSLRAGDRWEEELARQIAQCDVFYLFWSAAAKQSTWVEKEWRTAIAVRGMDYIHPVPLIDPRLVPPPDELAAVLHFNDMYRIVVDYEQRFTNGLQDS
jgi:hypothetical protein